ncbi:UNVERIFIED_CONTAM: hypothetical protein Slati_0010400 [Sesamum latifolium]|uniref:Reverse transcriptase Ty1/copia-type domain-containing protein n=1 Tax=Sesamum latifolium TaxID=2727402 RepID=A0AAW2Y6C8_9LAMI
MHGQKGCKLFDIEKKVTLVSRDVVFHENRFPYEGEQTDPITCSLPLPLQDISTDSNLDSSVPDNEEKDHTTQPPATDNILPELRRFTRTISKPHWMNDFICNYSINQTPPIVSAISSAHAVFAVSISDFQEPQTYNQTTQSDWINVMKADIQALENNQTWDITHLLHDKKAIGCRWIYKLKLRPDGTVDRHKARLVANN